MVTIPGASGFINASALANTQGRSAQPQTFLGATETSGLLESGRSALAIRGVGVSNSARALNKQFLNNTADINQMFSLGVGLNATAEGLNLQIKALRASQPTSNLAPGLTVDEEA